MAIDLGIDCVGMAIFESRIARLVTLSVEFSPLFLLYSLTFYIRFSNAIVCNV